MPSQRRRVFFILVTVGLLLFAFSASASNVQANLRARAANDKNNSAYPASAYGTAIIDGGNADRVHLRYLQSTESNSFGLYFTGTLVRCDSDPNKEWVLVAIGRQYGYIKSEFLYRGPNPKSVTPKQPTAVVQNVNAGRWVNLRFEPNLGAEAIGKLHKGDTVTVLGETVTKWYYVKAGDQYGYVMADYLLVGGPASPISQGPSGAAPSGRAALSAYQSVMQNKKTFFSASDHQAMYLSQLIGSFDDVPMRFTQFAVIDLDKDGIPEVVLWENIGGDNDYGFEVLHYQGGVVYGYDFVYRALMELKADGTFSFSSGAADNGFGTMKFTKTAYSIDETTYCRSIRNGISYFVNHKPATAAQYNSAQNKQQKKQGVAWHGFTDVNIEAMLSGF